MTPSAARFSPASSRKSPLRPAPEAAIPTAIPACAAPSPPPRQKTCPPTTSSAPSSAAPAKFAGLQYEEISYEGYGPGGVAIIVDCTTDNSNRAVSEIRHTFAKNGGNLGEPKSRRLHVRQEGRDRCRERRCRRRQAHGHRARSRRRRPQRRRRKLGDHHRAQ